MGADNGGTVPQDALDHHQVAAGLHRAAGLYHAVHMDVPHGPDGEAAEHVSLDIDVPQEVNASRGEVHVPRDVQHGLDLEAVTGILHVAGDRGQQGTLVLADLRISPLGQGDALAALGGDLLVQHCPARLALGGLDEPADLLALLHISDQVQGGVVHLVVFVHLQHPLDHPGEPVYNIAVLPVEGGLPLGNGVQGKVLVLIVAQPVGQAGVHAVADSLLDHRPVEHIPRQLLPGPHRREHEHPCVQLIRREEETGPGVQDHGLGLLFLSRLLPGLAVVLFRILSGGLILGFPAVFILALALLAPGLL